jgi:hypothetical protein
VSGGDALFSSLSQAADVRACSQVDVADSEAGELGGAQPGLAGEHQQGLVAAAGPRIQVGGGQHCRDLVLGEVSDQGLVVAFGRDRQDPCDVGGVLGVTECGVAEQGVDRGEPGVAGPDAVAAAGFQVVQERADRLRVQVGDVQPGRGLARALRREDGQHLERVAVGGDRVAAGLALQRQPVGEERLQGGGEGSHDSPCRWACSLSPASAISSGAAERYQLSRSRDNWYYSDSRVIPILAPLCA